jgi:hypothetical protein
LRFDSAGAFGVFRFAEVIAQRTCGLFGKAFNLAQIEPVGGDDRVQAAETLCQALGAGAGDIGDIEPVEQVRQRRAGGEFRVKDALLLWFDAAFAQQRDVRLCSSSKKLWIS